MDQAREQFHRLNHALGSVGHEILIHTIHMVLANGSQLGHLLPRLPGIAREAVDGSLYQIENNVRVSGQKILRAQLRIATLNRR